MSELRDLVDRHCGEGITATALPVLTLARTCRPSGPMPAFYHPLFCVIVSGRKTVFVGDRVLTYDPATYLLSTVDVPAAGRVIEAPCLSVVMTIDPATLRGLLLDTPEPAADAHADTGAVEPASGLSVNPLGPDLLDALLRLLRLLDRPQDAAVLGPMVEREILYRLLQGPCGGVLRQMARPDSQLSRVRRAIDLIRGAVAAPLAIDDLAKTASMSVTSLHRHFRAVTAMSPLQYQKQLRLLEARRLMLGGEADAAGAAYAVGYESPSQFSREYRRQFGQPPTKDPTLTRERMGAA